MKYSRSYFILIALLLTAGGCTDSILDREEKDVVPASQVLNTLDGIEAILFQVYTAGRSVHQNPDISLYKQCGTDLARSGTHMTDVPEAGMRGMMTYSSGLAATSDLITDIWDAYYAAISRCNLVILASENFIINDPSEEVKLAQFRGEALVMRAVMYLELVRRFENIPIAEPLPEGEPPRTKAPLADPSDIYNLIIADATEADLTNALWPAPTFSLPPATIALVTPR